MGDPQQDEPDTLKLRVTWVEAETLPIAFADQVLLQPQGDVVFMTVAQSIIPAIFGPDDPNLEAWRQKGTVGVRPLIRVAMTRATAAAAGKAFAKLGFQPTADQSGENEDEDGS